jgi:hypothetical protein
LGSQIAGQSAEHCALATESFCASVLELLDRHERYVVVLADRAKARLFTIFLGDIEESKEAFAAADVEHIKGPGTDHPLSQMQIQRKADIHAKWHLKDVSRAKSRLAQKHNFNRLILGGPNEVTSELAKLLPKSLNAKFVGHVTSAVEANIKEVLQETLRIEAEVELQRENELVESLITGAAKKQKAVVGGRNIIGVARGPRLGACIR